MFGDIWQDLRYGARVLGRSPGFTAVAVITLALGIGANTAIFSLFNKAILRPLPVTEPDRIIALNNTKGNGRGFPSFSYPNYKDLRDRNDTMSGLIAYAVAPVSLSHDGINERVWGYLASGNYFEVLGAKPALGRMFSPEDDLAPGAHPVAVISHRCWQQRFGGNPDAAGRNVVINGRSFTIIGVAPPNFIGLEVTYVPEIWFPLMMQGEIRPGSKALENRKAENLLLAGRLRAGVSQAQARAQLQSIAAQLAGEYPVENEGKTIELSPAGLFGTFMRGQVLGFAGVLAGVVGLVLLLVCTNLATLLLARAMNRRREIAVRLALGASRFRIVRQLLTESLLLAVTGGALGLLPAFWLTGAAGRIKLPMGLSTEMDIDGRVFAFTIAITIVTSLVFGLLPALQSTKPELVSALKDEAATGGHHRSWLRGSLVAAQVALSLVLMICAGLVLRGLQRAQLVNLGINPPSAVELSFDLDLQGYDRERGREFQQQLLARVRALPGVEAAGAGNYVPPDLHAGIAAINIEGRERSRAEDDPVTGAALAGPGYFQALGTRLLRGRDFVEQDDEKSPRVAVVNETFASLFWKGEDALGKRFRFVGRYDAPIQIVGIVENGKYFSLSEEPRPFVFTPFGQGYMGTTKVVARTSGDTASLIAAIRREVEQLDPHLPIFDTMTLTEHLSLPLLPARIAAGVLGSFGALALILATLGIFGVTSFTVSRRTREIGIRMALGARRSDVLRLVVGQGMTPALVGVGIGLISALALTRLMKSLLFGVNANDPLTFAMIAMLLTGVALAACYIPARRATKVDPMVALRYE
jgi:putative ABC transport system permease protein